VRVFLLHNQAVTTCCGQPTPK